VLAVVVLVVMVLVAASQYLEDGAQHLEPGVQEDRGEGWPRAGLPSEKERNEKSCELDASLA
jgi:hypothetical protein